MDPLCPVCRHKDRSCKVRFLNDQPLFSCKACFEAEEKRVAQRPRDLDVLEQLGYPAREKKTIDS
jgi:transcription elongation factor Elf1